MITVGIPSRYFKSILMFAGIKFSFTFEVVDEISIPVIINITID